MKKILEKVNRCSHEVIINEMCAVCGEDLRSRLEKNHFLLLLL